MTHSSVLVKYEYLFRPPGCVGLVIVPVNDRCNMKSTCSPSDEVGKQVYLKKQGKLLIVRKSINGQ